MNSVETSTAPPSLGDPSIAAQEVLDSVLAQPTGGQGGHPLVPYYLVVFHFQDGRSADLVVPGVTGMGGGGDAAGPGRLNIYGPGEAGARGTRLLGARLFNDLADLTVVPELFELEIEVAEQGE